MNELEGKRQNIREIIERVKASRLAGNKSHLEPISPHQTHAERTLSPLEKDALFNEGEEILTKIGLRSVITDKLKDLKSPKEGSENGDDSARAFIELLDPKNKVYGVSVRFSTHLGQDHMNVSKGARVTFFQQGQDEVVCTFQHIVAKSETSDDSNLVDHQRGGWQEDPKPNIFLWIPKKDQQEVQRELGSRLEASMRRSTPNIDAKYFSVNQANGGFYRKEIGVE